MHTIPQLPPPGKPAPPPCPHCGVALRCWSVPLPPATEALFWCGGCLRPVCLEVTR
jgi:hypothetical protein